MDQTSDLVDRISRLHQGDHLCLLHETDAARRAAIVTFFARGLAGGERCLYLAGPAGCGWLEGALAEAGVRIPRRESGALVCLTDRETFRRHGRLRPGAMVDLLRLAEQEALDDGFAGLRVAGEMSWAGAVPGAALTEYEALLGGFLPVSRTTGLCLYDLQQFSPAALDDLLRLHPLSAGDSPSPEASLPVAAAGSAATAAEEADERPAGRRVLVVEDNPDAGATLRDFLELSGFEVVLACTGTAGVEAARAFHPEVVLCDLGLPEIDGFEVATRLRRDPDTASVRLIAVTGYGREEDRIRSRAAGFDLHLTKPVDPTLLRSVLFEGMQAA